MRISFLATMAMDKGYGLEKYTWVRRDYSKGHSTKEVNVVVEKLLSERYKSIIINYHENMIQSFSFKDEAEEAEFLLWNSTLWDNGIEIEI